MCWPLTPVAEKMKVLLEVIKHFGFKNIVRQPSDQPEVKLDGS